jgi:uncharacterized membrane protein YcaP (DUF421 family)
MGRRRCHLMQSNPLPEALFDGWSGVLRVLIIAPAAYAALVLILRVSGKRTLSKLNAFDFVITIAIGSTLASIITSKSLALVEGLVALGLLVAMQFLVTAASVRFGGFNRVIKAEPALLLRDGRMLARAMRRARITAGEIEAAARGAGVERPDQLEAVFLETDGSLTARRRGT